MVETTDPLLITHYHTKEFFYGLDQITQPLAAVVKKIRTSMRDPTKADSAQFNSLLTQLFNDVIPLMRMKLVPLHYDEAFETESNKTKSSIISTPDTILREDVEKSCLNEDVWKKL